MNQSSIHLNKASSDHVHHLFNNLAPSLTLNVNEEVSGLCKQGKSVFHMGFGESRFAIHPKLLSAFQEHATAKSYLPVQGLLELREKIGQFYSNQLDLPINEDQVMIGPGSKSLIYGIQMALDAELLLPIPSWVSYAPQAHLLNRKISYIPSNINDGYQITVENLDKVVKASSHPYKLLVINSPNNPTGRMYKQEQLEELAHYCREHGILVLSDEIYFLVTHGDIPHVSIARYYPEGTLILGGLSKHLSLGGWRLGVGILPDNELGKKLMRVLWVIASETWSSVASPIQYAAISAYSADTDIHQYIQTCSQIHGIRSRYLSESLNDLGILCTKPEGGFYFVANFDRWKSELQKKNITCSTSLSRYLLDKHQIATLPGKPFGIPEQELSLRLASCYLDMEYEQDSDRLLKLYQNNTDAKHFMSEHHHPNTHKAIRAFGDFIASLS